VGETQDERDRGEARSVVLRQLEAVLAGLPGGARGIDVAYEPVWAIGTGRTATPDVAAEVHGWLRAGLDAQGGDRSRILYGGSVAPANIGGFLSQPGVDGVLVGGQSLDPSAFASLVDAARDATGSGSRT
jgi:triosephosphate isomerase